MLWVNYPRQQLLDAIASEVDAYNNTHEHRELPKRNGRHMTPSAYRRAVLEAEGDDIEYLTDVELREAFMPEMVRTAQRGWLRLFNNDYFSEELIRWIAKRFAWLSIFTIPLPLSFAGWMVPTSVLRSGTVINVPQYR